MAFPILSRCRPKSVADAAVRALETNGQWALQYGATMGAQPLVDVLLEKLARDQGIVTTPEQRHDHGRRIAGGRADPRSLRRLG